MPNAKPARGHLLALLTILLWGTTFISTKVLLRAFTPVEILFFRFALGFVALSIAHPRRLRLASPRQNLLFAGAGLCGITLYFLLENIALTKTTASNVSIILTVAPFFTALFSLWFAKAEKPKAPFYVGFVVALAGIALISYSGGSNPQFSPLGDLLSLLAALTWAAYSILTRKISALGHNVIATTRRIFGWGLLFMVPALFFMDFRLGPERFLQPVNTLNFLFLGLGASALCFVTWNAAVGILGAVKTSVYIYLTPVVTLIFSVLVLGEVLTPLLIAGAALTLAGLWLSETKFFSRGKTAAPLPPTSPPGP